MLERNVLAHLKLGEFHVLLQIYWSNSTIALLLSLLSSSALLKARLPDPGDGSASNFSKAGVPMATLQMVASLAAIGAAYYEYTSNMRAMRNMRAFLVATKYNLPICGVLLYDFSPCIFTVHTSLWLVLWLELCSQPASYSLPMKMNYDEPASYFC